MNRIYLATLSIATAVFCGCLIGFQYYLHSAGKLPAPPVSRSISFNEKIGFLADKGTKSCRILASGSSMTLDNLSSKRFESIVGKGNYLNIASWALTIRENYIWLQEFLRYCTPEVLIVVSFPNDFRYASFQEKNIDFSRVHDILGKPGNRRDYLNLRNAYYNIIHFSEVDDERKSRSMHESLYFDDGGGIPLDIDWSAHKRRDNMLMSHKDIFPDNYVALEKIAQWTVSRGIRFIFVQSVMRNKIREQSRPFLESYLGKIRQLATEQGFEFYNYLQMSAISDEHFIDNTHLNAAGGVIMTDRLILDAGLEQYAENQVPGD